MSPQHIACSECAQSTQKNTTYRRSTQTNTPGVAVHSDVCGAIKPTSRPGYRYFVTYLDEGSGYCSVEGLGRKSDVATATKTALLKIGNHFHRSITYFKTDNAKEYLSTKMDSFNKEHGIQMPPTVPYTPQKSGKAERIYHTLMSRGRAALIMSRPPRNTGLTPYKMPMISITTLIIVAYKVLRTTCIMAPSTKFVPSCHLVHTDTLRS